MIPPVGEESSSTVKVKDCWLELKAEPGLHKSVAALKLTAYFLVTKMNSTGPATWQTRRKFLFLILPPNMQTTHDPQLLPRLVGRQPWQHSVLTAPTWPGPPVTGCDRVWQLKRQLDTIDGAGPVGLRCVTARPGAVPEQLERRVAGGKGGASRCPLCFLGVAIRGCASNHGAIRNTCHLSEFDASALRWPDVCLRCVAEEWSRHCSNCARMHKHINCKLTVNPLKSLHNCKRWLRLLFFINVCQFFSLFLGTDIYTCILSFVFIAQIPSIPLSLWSPNFGDPFPNNAQSIGLEHIYLGREKRSINILLMKSGEQRSFPGCLPKQNRDGVSVCVCVWKRERKGEEEIKSEGEREESGGVRRPMARGNGTRNGAAAVVVRVWWQQCLSLQRPRERAVWKQTQVLREWMRERQSEKEKEKHLSKSDFTL